MFISIIFFIVVIVICMFAVVYAKARKVRQKHIDEHIDEAEKRGDIQGVERLKNMSDDEAADEFEDELSE